MWGALQKLLLRAKNDFSYNFSMNCSVANGLSYSVNNIFKNHQSINGKYITPSNFHLKLFFRFFLVQR